MSGEKKPNVWQLWTDRSKRTEWQNGYVSAFPIGIVTGIQFGMALMWFVQWLARR